MPKTVPPLSETQIRAMEPRATRYCVADGNGLVLEVMPTGNKVWRFRYTLDGKRQPLTTIGDYRRISLRVARERARKYAEMVAAGVSPAATARRDRGAEKRVDLLRDAAELYMTTAMASKSEEYQRTTRRALDKDVLQADRQQADRRGDVAKISSRYASGSRSVARRKWRCTRATSVKRLYEFLIARQLATSNPAAGRTGALHRDAGQPHPRAQRRRNGHHAARDLRIEHPSAAKAGLASARADDGRASRN